MRPTRQNNMSILQGKSKFFVLTLFRGRQLESGEHGTGQFGRKNRLAFIALELEYFILEEQ